MVQSFRVPDNAKQEVRLLAGMQLTNLDVAQFDVSLRLTSGRMVWVQINKPFRFRLDDEPWRDCDPTALPNGGVTGDTDFVRLVGRTCSHAILTEDEMVLSFLEGGALRVDLRPDDFEPVELRGDDGPGTNFFWIVW